MAEKYLTLNSINAYKISFNISNYVWDIFVKKENFVRNTLGSQFVRDIDSVSANIAEGFGRYNKKDKVSFYRIARASAYESLGWLEKSKKRNIVSDTEYEHMFEALKEMPREINSLIKYTNDNLKI